MPGSRLAAFFGRVVRAESFRLIVAPAIVDLQFECPTASRMRHARNHIGVWRAFVGALFSDFAWNAHTWLTDNVRRTPLHSHLSATWPALLLASYIACSLVFIADISTGAQKLSRSALIHNASLWGIPVAIMVATPPGRLKGNGGAVARLQIEHELEWVLTTPNGILVTANHVGHWVHRDDSALVARLVKHVLDHVGVTTRDLR